MRLKAFVRFIFEYFGEIFVACWFVVFLGIVWGSLVPIFGPAWSVVATVLVLIGFYAMCGLGMVVSIAAGLLTYKSISFVYEWVRAWAYGYDPPVWEAGLT